MIGKKKDSEHNMILGIVVFLCFLAIQLMFIDILSFMSVPFMVIMVGLLVFSMMHKHKNILLVNGHLWLVFSFSILCISALISVNLQMSLQYVGYYILYGLVFILLSFDSNWYSICIKIQLVFSLIHAVVTILSCIFPGAYYALILPSYSPMIRGQVVYWIENNNYPGIARQIGTNSFFISLGIAVTIAHIFSERTQKKGIQILLLVIFTYALFLTGKRGMLIGNILAVMVIWYLNSLSCRKSRIFKVISAFVIMLSTLYFFSGIIPTLEQTLGRFFNNWGDADFSSGRVELFRDAWKLFSHKYVFGYGINTYTTLNIAGFNTGAGAHNDVLQFLAEVGTIGTVTYFAPIIWIFVKTIETSKKIFNKEIDNSIKYHSYLSTSLYVQILILFYSIIGNPFHYYNMLFVYMIFSAIPIGIGLEIGGKREGGYLK